jgi:hypothetical protein
MDSESTTASRGRGTVWVIFFLVLVLIGYVLSPGPVIAFYENKGFPDWLYPLYAPLKYTIGNIPAVRAFYDWYLPLWQKPPPPKR